MATLLCVRCGEDTGCAPDLQGMNPKSAIALVEGWLCAECLDLQEEVDAAMALEKNRRFLNDTKEGGLGH